MVKLAAIVHYGDDYFRAAHSDSSPSLNAIDCRAWINVRP
ncbi:hypothetical protein BwSH12_75180 [Bradyrhizobium ottawaense]|nr:hypothetical protein BwSH12_75180 [Bradyrhizobium ottawaense]